MICLVDAADPCLSLAGGHPLIAANIGGRAACPQPEQDFGAMREDDQAVGFLCRVGETLYATAPREHSEEVAQFAAGVGFKRLITDLVLPFEHDRPLLAMEYGGTPLPVCGDCKVSTFTEPSPQFSAVTFARLQQRSRALATAEETQRFAVSLSHELRHGSAAAVTLELDGQLAAGAALCHRYNSTAVLCAVAVLPEYRGQGLGHTIAAAACQTATQWGALPFLCCNPALERLYRRAGFVPSEPIYCYTPNRKD